MTRKKYDRQDIKGLTNNSLQKLMVQQVTCVKLIFSYKIFIENS